MNTLRGIERAIQPDRRAASCPANESALREILERHNADVKRLDGRRAKLDDLAGIAKRQAQIEIGEDETRLIRNRRAIGEAVRRFNLRTRGNLEAPL